MDSARTDALMRIGEMLGSILGKDRAEVMKAVAREVIAALNAEACSVFLTPSDRHDMLRLEANSIDLQPNPEKPLLIAVKKFQRRSLAGWLASEGESRRMQRPELLVHPGYTRQKPVHIPSGQCDSLMFIPLNNRKGQLVGALTIDNKLGADGKPNPSLSFTDEDEQFGNELAKKIVLVVEGLRRYEAFNEIVELLDQEYSLTGFLEKALGKVMNLVSARRADFFRVRADGDLLVEGSVGPTRLNLGDSAPRPSIVRRVLRTGVAESIPDVAKDLDYSRLDLSVRQQVTTPVSFRGQTIGVLNVESDQELDSQDFELIKAFSRRFGIACQLMGRDAAVRSLLPTLVAPPSHRDILERTIEVVRPRFNLTAAIIYQPDYRTRELSSVISVGCDDKKIAFRLEEPSLATYVFNENKPEYVEDPAGSTICNPKGLREFQIDAPLIGLPLRVNGRAIGALVCWNPKPNVLRPADIELLQPVAEMLAASMHAANAAHERAAELAAITEILLQMQLDAGQEQILGLIMAAIRAVGFDRVRTYQFLENPARLEAITSSGMDHPERFRSLVIPLASNHYAHELRQWAQHHHSPKLYDTRTSNRPDPHGKELGKPDECQWVCVPLIISRQFRGAIAADTVPSKREIPTAGLQYLTVLGVLAAHVIARAEQRTHRHEEYLHEVLETLANPILCISEGTKALRNHPDDPEEWIDALYAAGQTFTQLVTSGLTLELFRNRRGPLASVFLQEEVDRAMLMSKPIAAQHDVRLEFGSRNDSLKALAYPPYIKVALGHLLANAIRFSGPGQSVRVDCMKTPGFVEVWVTDKGRGVHAEYVNRIFEPNFSVPPEEPRAGLGLFVVRSIAQGHGGNAGYTQPPGGVGARFWLRLREE